MPRIPFNLAALMHGEAISRRRYASCGQFVGHCTEGLAFKNFRHYFVDYLDLRRILD